MSSLTRRRFTAQLLKGSSAILTASPLVERLIAAPAIIEDRPRVTHGIASGDVSFDSAVIWSRADRRARMLVEWSTTESFHESHQVRGEWTGEDKDFTAKWLLRDLPPGQRIFYRVQFEDASGNISEPATGQLLTAAQDQRDVFFAFSGDTCGQGYGINPEFGGLKTYESIRRARPDFFVHSGDNIYADGVIEPELRDADGKVVKLPDGRTWKNLTTPEKSKVAETLAEFRGNYRYNLLDENVRRCNVEVSIFSQWDDHEVLNNWYPGKMMSGDPKYTVKDVNVLAAHARQAFFDYLPLRGRASAKVYRTISRGPLCELFFLDQRTYRGPNSANRQPTRSRETDYMGERQLDWLKDALLHSRAVWKVICSDMPIGIVVGDSKDAKGRNTYENCANGNGPALGRELEIAELLRFIKQHRIRNTFWLTADVHYAASLFYDPAKAQFTDFNGFWEFVSGPLHAASLAPGGLDNTFGPEFRWTARKKGSKASGPYTNEQYFSTVRIDGKTKVATITHCNRDGEKLWSMDLAPDLAMSPRG
jgi:alkaline phosphatase D